MAWRDTYAQHFSGPDGNGIFQLRDKTASTACDVSVAAAGGFPPLEADVATRPGRKIPTVATFDLFKDRGDLHLGLKAHDVLDCTHYCYAPHLVAPTYARVVDALLQPP